MTQDRTRKLWRRKLHAKRCADNDQSPLRYYNDAKLLNRAMAIYKIKGALALWGKDAD